MDYDFLHVCTVCGDRYCSGSVCPQCQTQTMIDNGLLSAIFEFGHCPACGGYTRTIGGNYDTEPQQDICDDCGWMSEIDYP